MTQKRNLSLRIFLNDCRRFLRKNRRETLWSAAIVGYCAGAPALGMVALLLFVSQGDWVAALESAAATVHVLPLLVIGLGAALAIALFPSFGLAAALAFSLNDRTTSFSLVVAVLCLGTWKGILLGKWLRNAKIPGHPAQHPRVELLMQQLPLLGKPTLSWILVCLRLSPHVPFALTNILVAQLPLPAAGLTALSVLGLLPRTLFAWQVGVSLDSWEGLSERGNSFWFEVSLSVVLLAAVAALTLHARQKLNQLTPPLGGDRISNSQD